MVTEHMNYWKAKNLFIFLIFSIVVLTAVMLDKDVLDDGV